MWASIKRAIVFVVKIIAMFVHLLDLAMNFKMEKLNKNISKNFINLIQIWYIFYILNVCNGFVIIKTSLFVYMFFVLKSKWQLNFK